MNSKVGILARRRLEFEEAKLIVEAAQLRPKLGDGDNFKINGCQRCEKPTYEFIWVYTQSDSKVGIWQRGRLEFEPGEAGAKSSLWNHRCDAS